MADTRKMSPLPAKNGGNRVQPALANKVPKPPDFKTTFGVGDGAGGGPVPANNGGNRVQPKLANQIPLPSDYDNYQSSNK